MMAGAYEQLNRSSVIDKYIGIWQERRMEEMEESSERGKWKNREIKRKSMSLEGA